MRMKKDFDRFIFTLLLPGEGHRRHPAIDLCKLNNNKADLLGVSVARRLKGVPT